jgi:hypothetical protein
MIARAAFILSLAIATAPRAAWAQEGAPSLPSVQDHVSHVLREHMRTCWQMPPDTPDSARLVVTVEFDLNEDGSLDGAPRVTSPRNYAFDRPMRRAVKRALRAVRTCAPYPFAHDPITVGHYDTWDELEITFRRP